MLNTTKDFDTWMAEFGPRNTDEAIALSKVVDGAEIAAPYIGSQADTGWGWFIRRQGDVFRLNLTALGRREGFKKFVWYYLTGARPFIKWQPKGLEVFFADA